MFVQNQNRKEVVAQHSCAAKIIKVCGGYMVFATIADFQIWKNQK